MDSYGRKPWEEPTPAEKVIELIEKGNPGQPPEEFSIKTSPLPSDPDMHTRTEGTRLSFFLEFVLPFLFRRASDAASYKAYFSDSTINIKDKVYQAGSIERVEAHGESYLDIHAEGEVILKVPMEEQGCEELVKWAKYHRIPVLKTGGDELSRLQKILIAAAGIAVFGAVAAIIIYFSFR